MQESMNAAAAEAVTKGSSSAKRGQRQRRRPWQIRSYFVALAGSFIVVGVAALAFIDVRAPQDARNLAEKRAQFAADIAARKLGDALTVYRSSVGALAANPTIVNVIRSPAGCTLTFGGGHLDLLRPDGTVVCSSRAVAKGQRFPSYIDKPWVSRALHRASMVAPALDTTTGAHVVRFTAPVGTGQGIVAGFVDLAPVAADLAASYGGGQLDVFLVTSRDSRTVIARSIAPQRWIGAPLAGTPFGPTARGIPHADLDGKKRLYAESTIPSVGWHMYVGADEAASLAAAGRLVRHQLEIILVGLAAALLASYLIYRRVARPITRLAAAVRASSTLSGPSTVPEAGPAEVAALGEDVNGLISSVRKELHERVRAEAQAKQFAAIVESSNDAIIGKSLDGTITSWNTAAERIYGYSAREAIGSPVSMLAPEELQSELPELLTPVREGARIEQYETIRRRKDGTEIDVSLTISPIKDRHGTVIGASTIARDVTDHRRLEEQLRQAQKMEAVGNLAGGIAHDFNNLLLVVRGYSTRLLEKLEDPSLRESAQQIDNAAQRAGEFTHQLLAFSRQQVLRPEVTDLNEVVADTLKLLQHAIGDEIQIESQLEPDVLPIHVDRGQLTQAVLNLAINARDSMSDAGGMLSVRTAHAELDQAYADRHEDVTAGSYSVLQITDSGKGMDLQTQSRVFDPFFTTKEDGTGLGLASVYGLVKQSGGHIWLYSEPGLGTTFKLYFPTSSGEIVRHGEPVATGSLHGTETILLVEDAEIVRLFVATTLEGYGYHVLAAAGGTEAIELAEHADGPIDLLMTDVVMPWMNGRELVERLAPDHPKMKVLYTSGYPSDTIVREGISEAGAAFIEKPYLPVDLAGKVREVLSADHAAAVG